MAEPVVSFLISRFSDFILKEAKSFSKSAKYKKIQRLERELKRMQCFLKDADAKQDQDEIVRQKMAEIRDLAYDADNILDKYDIQIASKKNEGHIKSRILLNEMRTMRKLGSEIDGITDCVTELITSLQAYGIEEQKGGYHGNNTPKEKQRRQLRRTFSHVVQTDIVGLEEQTQKLLEQLLSEKRTRHVVSICGMGGSGKTTLAKKLYHHEKVRSHFNCFAWACISQQWDVRQVWREILIKLTGPDALERNRIWMLMDHELAKELYQVQLKTKCLIVVDDIWSEDAWDSLRAGFPEGNITSSKILLTSRNIEVAQHVDPRGFIHEPRPLNELESWELFAETAVYGREETGFIFDKCIEELGHAMIKYCGGLPLTIKVLGGIMATKNTIDEWTRVYEDVKIYIRGKDQVKEIFDLSYNDLPYHLKPCFLCFSNYQEDDIIKRKKLNHIWMAEGFIPSGKSNEEVKEMESIAEESLEQLVLRCMVQVEKRGFTGKIKTCKIHDIMRDLCIQQAQKEGFMHLLNLRKSCVSFEKVRRLVLLDSDKNANVGNEKYAHTRSLISKLPRYTSIGDLMFHRLKFLRVLILNNVEFQMPNEIGELFHLRLLDLSGSSIGSIPPTIGNLSFLLTLKLDIHNCKEIPSVIAKLKRLRHLYLLEGTNSANGKLELANLSSLQTLAWYPGHLLDPMELAKLSSLKKLKIYVEKNWLLVFHSLPENTFKNLYSLSMNVDHGQILDVEKVGLCCPNLCKLYTRGGIRLWDANNRDSQFLHNLTELGLSECDFSNDPMFLLGKLPKLRHLHLGYILGLDTIVCSQNSFPRLESLQFYCLQELGEWIIEEGALRCLCTIKIGRCNALNAMPEGLRFINGLKDLLIMGISDKLKDRITKGGEDFHKIQHVIKITIN